MAEWWPFDRSRVGQLQRGFSEVLAMSSAAAAALGLPPPGSLLGDPFAAIVDTARAALIGRQRTFSFYGSDLTLILEDLSVEGADLPKAVGQYGQVRICARDVEWGAYRFERIEIQARNLHLRPGAKPTLVAAPVLCEAFVSASVASRWLPPVSPRLELATYAGIPQIGMVGAPWARLEVEAVADGRSIRIQPRAVHLLERRVAVRAPAFHLPLPPLPFDVTLTSVKPAPGGFVMRGILTEWQRSLSRADLERLLAKIRAGKERPDS